MNTQFARVLQGQCSKFSIEKKQNYFLFHNEHILLQGLKKCSVIKEKIEDRKIMHFKAKFIHRKHRWSIIWFYLKMAKGPRKHFQQNRLWAGPRPQPVGAHQKVNKHNGLLPVTQHLWAGSAQSVQSSWLGPQGQGTRRAGRVGHAQMGRWGAHPKERASLALGYLCGSQEARDTCPRAW